MKYKNFKLKNWVITGGCGFIGSNLIRKLINLSDIKIRVIDNLIVGNRINDLNADLIFKNKIKIDWLSQNRILVFNSSILNKELVNQIIEGADVIIHLAANTGVQPSLYDPYGDLQSNVLGTFFLLEAARKNKVKKFIFSSSGASIGQSSPPIHEELAAHPLSPYGASKLASEGYCSAYFYSFGLNTTVLRFGNAYGPYSDHKESVVAKFIKNASEGENLKINGKGNQTRDFIYVEDIVNAIIHSYFFSKESAGEIFQIATNTETTINDLALKIKNIFAQKFNKQINITFGEKMKGEVLRNYSDTSKAKKRLKWSSEINLEEGLFKTINYFIK